MTVEETIERIRERQRKLGGRLILRCHPSVLVAFRALDDGRPELIPPPRTEPSMGLTYRSVEVEVRGSLAPGAWRLLDDGEVVADGVIQ